MTLRPCVECGHRVSPRAQSCPNCGAVHPLRRAPRGRKLAILIGAFLAVGWWINSQIQETADSLGLGTQFTSTDAPARPSSSSLEDQFEIVEVSYRWDGDMESLRVLGQVKNNGSRAAGVELLATGYRNGRVIGTSTFWPASTGNIAPGETWPISYTIAYEPADEVEVRIVRARAW